MQDRTAIQSSMNIGEKPSQGELFPEWRGDDGFREALTRPPAPKKELPLLKVKGE